MIEWIAMLLSITGSLLSASAGRFREKDMRLAMLMTFTMWTIANLLWLFVSLFRNDFPQVILWSVFLSTSVWGLIRWKKPEVKEDHK